ncbi:MAG: DUF6338 family protein [Spirochaetaceae bacterium]
MSMDFVLYIIFLLPGFLIVKMLRLIKEYEKVSIFEQTITSLGFSILIISGSVISIMIHLNSLLKYGWNIQRIISNFNLDQINVDMFYILGYSLINFFVVGITTSFIIYLTAWFEIPFYISSKLNMNHRTKKLTPWDDFFDLNSNRWVSVSLEDGTSFVGVPLMASHSPHDKEFVLSSADNALIDLYKGTTKIDSSLPIENVYISGKNINSIISYRNPIAKEHSTKKSDNIPIYILIYIFLIIFFMLKSAHYIALSILVSKVIYSLWLVGLIILVLFYFRIASIKKFYK